MKESTLHLVLRLRGDGHNPPNDIVRKNKMSKKKASNSAKEKPANQLQVDPDNICSSIIMKQSASGYWSYSTLEAILKSISMTPENFQDKFYSISKQS